MIKVTRINGKELVVNAELIEFIESTPDTIISLTTGRKLVVLEATDEVIQRIVTYKKLIVRPFHLDDMS
ncbi:MAG: flagellar FlbD family protein [Bacillota bacterium]|nr:flagellar FlbD family protein [Bacillota bacterium]